MTDKYDETFRALIDDLTRPHPEIKLYKVRIENAQDLPEGAPAIDLLISIYGDEIEVATRPALFPDYSWSAPFRGKRL